MKNFKLLSLFLLIAAAEMHASSEAFDEQGFMKLILESMALSEMLKREASSNLHGSAGDLSDIYQDANQNIVSSNVNPLRPNDKNKMVVYNPNAKAEFNQSINQAIKNNNDANDHEMYRKLAEQAKLTPSDQNQMVVYNPNAQAHLQEKVSAQNLLQTGQHAIDLINQINNQRYLADSTNAIEEYIQNYGNNITFTEQKRTTFGRIIGKSSSINKLTTLSISVYPKEFLNALVELKNKNNNEEITITINDNDCNLDKIIEILKNN